MNAPAEFVVARHLLAHPDEAAGDLAAHCGLHRPVVHNALKRLRAMDLLAEPRLLHHLISHPRRIRHRAHYFRVPNPKQWLNALSAPCLLSGDVVAAEKDGYNVVPEQWVAYVRPGDEAGAVRAATEVFADVASKPRANLVIKIQDPWLKPDEQDPRLAERGQRLIDYQDSPLLQLVGRPP